MRWGLLSSLKMMDLTRRKVNQVARIWAQVSLSLNPTHCLYNMGAHAHCMCVYRYTHVSIAHRYIYGATAFFSQLRDFREIDKILRLDSNCSSSYFLNCWLGICWREEPKSCGPQRRIMKKPLVPSMLIACITHTLQNLLARERY